MNAWIDYGHEAPAYAEAHFTHETVGKEFHWRVTYVAFDTGFFSAGMNVVHANLDPSMGTRSAQVIQVVYNLFFSRVRFELDVTSKESQ